MNGRGKMVFGVNIKTKRSKARIKRSRVKTKRLDKRIKRSNGSKDPVVEA